MARILVADDDSASYEVLSVALMAEGHEVFYAANGQEALELAEEIRPDLVFLDVMMPVFDGYETCERMRNAPDIPAKLPIVFLTSTEENPQKMEQVGASDYLTKRHMVADLQDMLVKHLGPKAFPD
ncbi:MAG: response regulator [Candidatus Hydrogenedentota bacterium]